MSSHVGVQVAAHPSDRQQNILGRKLEGPALLQIWRIGDGLPSLALALCLHGGLVWDCKWQPGSGPCHGDGSALSPSLSIHACMDFSCCMHPAMASMPL